jgi:hypothetical protein
VRLNLKIAILKSGKTQRQISINTGIPETRLSELVCNRANPTTHERSQLERALGDRTVFAGEPLLEVRGRR